MKLNWKLLCLDILTLAYVVINIWWWNDLEEYKKLMHTVLSIGFLLFRIGDHYRLYKKEMRFY
jgi:hypothetical protein